MAGKDEQHEGVSSLSDMMATPITPAAKPRVSLHIVLGLVTLLSFIVFLSQR